MLFKSHRANSAKSPNEQLVRNTNNAWNETDPQIKIAFEVNYRIGGPYEMNAGNFRLQYIDDSMSMFICLIPTPSPQSPDHFHL